MHVTDPPPLEVFQTEWCPHSARVRQRLTELGVSYVARPVPADRDDREEPRRKAGTDEIPVLVLDDGTVLTGDVDALIAELEARFSERADAPAHRAQAAAHGRPR